MQFGLRLCQERAIYLWVAFATPPIAQFAHYLDPVTPLFKAQAAGVILGLSGLLIAALLWLPFRRATPWPTTSRLALVIILVTWTYATVLTQLDGSTFNLTTFSVPIVVAMVLLKPPAYRDVIGPSMLFAYALIASATASLILGEVGLAPDGFASQSSGNSRLPLLNIIFGISARWEGPFGNVNYAGPVGAFLVVFGASMKSWRRFSVVAGGACIMLLSEGRNALLAMVLGLFVLLAFSDPIGRLHRAAAVRFTLLGAILIGSGAYILVSDPTLSGRVEIWSAYLRLWWGSPWLGVGGSGITQYVIDNSGDQTMNHVHGHSVFIDTLARNGVFMLALFLAVLICTGIVAFRAAQIGQPAGLALFAFMVVAGLAETVHSMDYLSVNLVPLFIALFLSSSALAARESPPQDKPAGSIVRSPK
jgi:O-antigen ligase